MQLTNTLLTIVCALMGLAWGLICGLLPRKNNRLTDGQQRWIPVLSLIGVGLVVILILLERDGNHRRNDPGTADWHDTAAAQSRAQGFAMAETAH